MKLVKQARFGTLVMDFYMNENKDIFVTRNQIGEVLGYGHRVNIFRNGREQFVSIKNT